MFIVPFVVLFIVNTGVLLAIRRSNRLHFTSQCADESAKKAEAKERQTTIMLIAIVLVFIFCNTLAFVVNILENLDYTDDLYELFVTFSNLLVSQQTDFEESVSSG